MELSDSELIARTIVMGNKHAFGRLVNRHQSAMRSLLYRLTKGDVEWADDLAQETFLMAYKKLKTFKGKSKFSSWLYRIAYNKFLEDVRKPINKIHITEADENNFTTSSISQKSDIKLDLEKAMVQLDQPERVALTLTYTLGLTNTEVSEVMALPLGTVKSHILRGKEKLKTILRPWERMSA